MVVAKLVTDEDVAKALERLKVEGGRLGDNLVAIGAITQERLNAFMHRIPTEPADIRATGIDEVDLMGLLLKLIYRDRLETTRQFVEAIKLPYHIVHDLIRMAVERQLLQTLGSRYSDNPIDLSYSFTEEGRRWTLDALDRLRYTGPAPVTLEEFNYQVNMQKLTNEIVTIDRIRKVDRAISTSIDSIIEQVGPGAQLRPRHPSLWPPGQRQNLHGPLASAASSTTSFTFPTPSSSKARSSASHDPSIHITIDQPRVEEEEFIVRCAPRTLRRTLGPLPPSLRGHRRRTYSGDARPALRPYRQLLEAPLHMKALGGCFVIDDFGRQLVSPTHLLNRWIVPLENRVDYLKLHTGKSFSIPFEELIMFSTNLEPEDLMDPAFLRRLPYKIEVGRAKLRELQTIFERECEKQGMTFPEEVFDSIVRKLRDEKELDFAAYQPKFIIDQVVATCRLWGSPRTSNRATSTTPSTTCASNVSKRPKPWSKRWPTSPTTKKKGPPHGGSFSGSRSPSDRHRAQLIPLPPRTRAPRGQLRTFLSSRTVRLTQLPCHPENPRAWGPAYA